jgi:Ca2+/H+ antiporter
MALDHVYNPVSGENPLANDTRFGQNIEDAASEEQTEVADEDEPEIPEEWKKLSPEEARKFIFRRSCTLTILGTGLCLLFSDPMVGVLAEIGNRIGVPAFYVSFVLAPLVSNATELIASYRYAQRKTEKAMTISLSIHPGAAIMNNTFVMGIFLLLVFAKKLAWSFAAETIAILVVEVFIAFMSLKKVHTLGDALIILSFYPISLVIVWSLEYAGLD